jgi:hypothetical protein
MLCPSIIIPGKTTLNTKITLARKRKMSKTTGCEFYSFYKFVLTPENPWSSYSVLRQGMGNLLWLKVVKVTGFSTML